MSETVGQRIRRLRLERGLSQRALSESGATYAYISRIEAGTRTPSVKALRMIAPKLGVSADYLEFGEPGEPVEVRMLLDGLGVGSVGELAMLVAAARLQAFAAELDRAWREQHEAASSGGASPATREEYERAVAHLKGRRPGQGWSAEDAWASRVKARYEGIAGGSSGGASAS